MSVNVPDPAVYASIPVVAGSLLWIGRQFVVATVEQVGPKGDVGAKGATGDPGEMTVDNYRKFSDFLIERLNGRYLLATDARERFDKIDSKLDHICNSCPGRALAQNPGKSE